VLGALLALVALVLHRATGSSVPDALAGTDVTAALARMRVDVARELPAVSRLYLTPVPRPGD
jgi:hypothetical protein